MGRFASRLPQAGQLKAADLVLFCLLMLVVVGLHPLTPIPVGVMTGDGDMDRQLAYLLLFFGAIVALRATRDLRNLLPFPLSLTLLLAWCWLSLFWAVTPMIALRRLTLTSILIWTVFMAVDRAGFHRTTMMMRVVLLAALVLNYLAVLFTPIGVHHVGDVLDPGLVGNWRGFLPQKNFAGAVCAITIILLVFVRDNMGARWRLAIIAVTGYFLLRTVSKTSIGLLAVALLCGWVYAALNPRQRAVLIPVVALAGIVGAFLVSSYLSGYHSPDALTGRIQIWPALWEYARQHPWLGSGFGAFWNIGPQSPIFQYARSWVTGLASGHNGYLDILVQLGMPGLLLTIVALVVLPGWTLLSNTQVPSREGAFLVACLVFCAGHNLTESNLLNRDAFVEIFQMFTIALTAQFARQKMPLPRRAVARRHDALTGTGSLPA